MGATYTRQSSYSDGDVITAAHTNDEFNQLLAAFASSSGHTHDGTSAEGGPITKLLGNTLTFGAGTAGTDITVTFDGETSDGVLKWMEDEDYFEFSDDILVASTEKLQFRDTAIYINSSTDGQLDIVADTEVQIAATTIDMNGNADVSGTLTYGSLSDGAITITAFVDEDNMASNSATLVPTQQSVKAYVDTQLTAEDLDFQADSGGALSIDLDSETLTFTGGTGIDTSGSGNAVTFAIDSTVATLAGTQTFTNKTLTSPKINENVALTATATELNLLDGVSGLVQADFTKLAAVDSTATELNIVDGNTSIGTTTVSDGHGIVMNHGGTMAQTTVQTLAAYLDDEITAMPNLVTTAATTVGALNSGSITSGFGTIDTGSSTITTTGLITGGSLDIDDVLINGTTIGHTDDTDLITLSNGVVTVAGEVDAVTLDVSGNIDVDGTANLDNTDIDGTLVVDGSNISLDSTSTLNIDNSNTSNGITIGTATSGVPVSIGHTTSETTVNDNLTVTGDLTVSGTTTTVNSTTVNLNDHNIVLDTGNTTSAVINGAGITIEGGSGDDATFTYNTTGPQFELKLGSSFEDLQTAKLTATELDISGDVDVDGTLEADAITVNGTALGTVIAGTTVTNATTAAVATTVTISDNENTDEDNAIIFTAGGDVDGGNIGLESDGDLTYNPSTGNLTTTKLTTTGNIELGHASDTTLSGSSGVLSVEGNAVLTTATGASKGFATAMAIAL